MFPRLRVRTDGQITRFLGGIVLAMDYKMGMDMMAERTFQEHEAFFQDVLEFARRHKIMNPEKMRTEYAKVPSAMACSPSVHRRLWGDSCIPRSW